MVKIRMARQGSKKRPFYQIVVSDVRKKRDGGYIEKIGFFNPLAKGGEERLRLDLEKVGYWVDQGAETSTRVSTLIKEARSAAASA